MLRETQVRRSMASYEDQLISHIVVTGKLDHVVRWGITVDDFLHTGCRRQFMMLQSHAERDGADGRPMGIHAFTESNPGFVVCHDDNTTTDYLCESVRKQRVAVRTEEALSDLSKALDGDIVKAVEQAELTFTELRSLLMRKDTDVAWEESYERLLQEIELRKEGVETALCDYPWDPLNKVTLGIEKTDYILFYGRPKSFKSWVLAWLIMHAYNRGLRVLVYTKEMSPDNIFARMTAILHRMDYHALKMRQLTEYDEQQLYHGRDLIIALRRATGQRIIALKGADVPEGGDTVPWLRTKISEHKPHILAIDGAYLLSDVHRARKDHERVRNISRGLRQLALSTGVPVLATSQANREDASDMRDMAFSDAFGQDITGGFRCVKDKGSPTVSLIVSGVREFALNGFRIWAKPAVSFDFHSTLSAREVEKVKENDTGEADSDEEQYARKRSAKTKRGKAVANRQIAASMREVREPLEKLESGHIG